MDEDASFITDELEAAVGRDTPPRTATLDADTVRRVVAAVEGHDLPLHNGDEAPPYALLAFERSVPLPPIPAAPATLVTGDEFTFVRALRVGERLTLTGRLDSANERFGARFGHMLTLRTSWTVADGGGATVALIGRSIVHYRPPAEGSERLPPTGWAPHDSGQPPESPLPPPVERWREGERLPAAIVRPTRARVEGYVGLGGTNVAIFLDEAAARAAGLPGTIVPGPLKLALLTRYVMALAGPRGRVRAVRAAHRRPDGTGRPLTTTGLVTRVTHADGLTTVECEVWTENLAGERSVAGFAAIELPQSPA